MRIKIGNAQIVQLVIVALFACDMLVGLLDKIGAPFYRVSLFPRLLFEGVCLLYLLKTFNRPQSRNFGIIAVTCVLITTLGFIAFALYGYSFNIGEVVVTLNKYILVFIVFPYLRAGFNEQGSKNRIGLLYTVIIVIASCLVISGLLFRIPLFMSYDENRFGYKGLFYAVNEASLFFILAQLYGMYTAIYNKKIWLLVLSTCASFLLGTKAGIISPVLIWGSMIWYKNRSGIRLVRFAVVTALLLVVIRYVVVPATIGPDKVLSYFVYDASRSNVLTMLLSGRNVFITERLIPYHEGRSVANILLGGVNNIDCSVEMDFFDLYLFMGVIGGVVFLVGYCIMFFGKGCSFYLLTSFTIIVFTAATGGHVFYSANNAIYLVLVILMGRSELKKNVSVGMGQI